MAVRLYREHVLDEDQRHQTKSLFDVVLIEHRWAVIEGV